MDPTFWHKQSSDKPLFPELLWSRPENRQSAGKLLIIGGNLHGFAAPAEAYQESVKAGVGTSKVLLPDALQKTVGTILEHGEYAPSTPSGSFSQLALGEFLEFSNWADAVLFAGDLGRNSETAIVLEKFLAKSPKPVTLTKDSLDYFSNNASLVFQRPDTTIVCTIAQLQRLCKEIKFSRTVTFGMDMLQLVELLHEVTSTYTANIVLKHLEILLVASGGRVSTTKSKGESDTWRVSTAAHVAVWWLQNPSKPFEALTTAQLRGETAA